MSDFQYADLIILALIAVFIGLRLRNTLGKDIGHRPDLTTLKRQQQEQSERVIPLPTQLQEEQRQRDEEEELAIAEIEDNSVSQELVKIRELDPAFSVKEFLEGAKGAFEWVIKAYNAQDKDTLKSLMSSEVYEDFKSAIEEREAAGSRTETTLVSIDKADIIGAELKRSMARLTVRFVTGQIQVERSKDGKIVSGDPSHVAKIEDEWVFERSLKSRNPNWTIVGT